MPDGLAAFIAERLDEAEAAARAASSEHLCPEARDGRWQVVGKRNVAYRNASEIITAVDVTGGPGLWYEQVSVKGDPDMAVASHIAANDPARVLRAIAAKRAILNAYICTDGGSPRDRDRGRWDAMHATIRHLAAEWDDHPAYLPEWSPEPPPHRNREASQHPGRPSSLAAIQPRRPRPPSDDTALRP